jgi:isoquinoline 1-oxidoreductase subunit beta
MTRRLRVGRREFLQRTAMSGAALTLGFYLPGACTRTGSKSKAVRPNAWIRITVDNQITLLTEMPELGQGARTVGAMMLAEELEADWSTLRVEQAPVIPEIYKHLETGGSHGTARAWDYMRAAGSQARELMLTAAALTWGVNKKECYARNSAVAHVPTERRLTYGQLVEAAAKLPVPDSAHIPLKEPSNFRLLGKSMPRVDVPAKVDGSATFGIDVRVPGMLYAVIARCPHFGGGLSACNLEAARAVPGVRAVFTVPPIGFVRDVGINVNTAGGVAVVADSTWAAIQGRQALTVSWDKGPEGSESTNTLRDELRKRAVGPPTLVAVNRVGDLTPAVGRVRTIDAFYELPFQAHATMEPMNTTVHIRPDGIEVWSPTQIGAEVQQEIAVLAGLPADKVTVHMMLCGGSFGRRYQWDFPAEAWQVARRMSQPVQLVWTREDDMQHDFYRQYSYHHLSASVDTRGNLTKWQHRVVSTPIRTCFDAPEKLKDPHRVALQELNGADLLPYEVSDFHLDYAPVRSAVPRAWWRSVASSFNPFAVECFIDELAHAAGRDPLEFRMALLKVDRVLPGMLEEDKHDPALETRRFRNVLQLAAEKSAWGNSLPAGCGRGIACCYSFGSYIAHVAEVFVEADGTPHVRRVISAVDCGTAVNPDGVKAMTEGGINFALTPVLSGEITIRDAAVQQSNFDTYRVLRMNEAPDIEVYLVPGTGTPRGMGEAGVPPLAPAVANAVFAATGVRVRRLPLDPKQLKRSADA